MTIHIDGLSPEAEITTNEKGGKESKPIGRFDLIPIKALEQFYGTLDIDNRYINHLYYMILRMSEEINSSGLLVNIIETEPKFLEIISKVLEEGAKKYSRNNWRLISPQSHFNHALIHLYALIKGDTQDDHYAHFLTRIAMFAETDKDNYDFKGIE